MTTSSRHLEPVPDTDTERVPPHDDNAERIVLGAMMLSPNAVADVSDILQAGDFYTPRHTELFQLIVGAFARSEPTDVAAINNRLTIAGDIGRYSNGTYLADLVEAVPTVANAAYYARTVAAKAARRRLLEASAEIARIAHRHLDEDPTALADAASAVLYKACDQHISSDVTAVGDLIDSALAAIEQAGQRKGLRGLSTGLRDLDRITGGLQPGQLWVVAARPGVGKTVFATDTARAVAFQARQPVLAFSLEMSKDEMMQRILAAESGVALYRLQNGSLSDAELTAVARAAGEIGDAPLHIDDTASATLAAIRAKARRLAQRGGLALLTVDYLQLMQHSTGRRSDNREREVAELSRGLKMLAKELAIPVIAVAQLNRGPEQRNDKTPTLGDLRESGALENDADVVLLLYRPDYYAKGGECDRAGEVDVIVAKNRHGACDTVTAAAQLHLARFADVALPN